jgi:hypothetical protein
MMEKISREQAIEIAAILERSNHSNWDSLYWEIQEGGNFLSLHFKLSASQNTEDNILHVSELVHRKLDPIMPVFEQEYSWIGVFICEDVVVYSIFGGLKGQVIG